MKSDYMGRIKSTAIKRAARTLVNENTELTDNFETNKKILSNFNLPDKETRNKIAGQITRLKKMEKRTAKKSL